MFSIAEKTDRIFAKDTRAEIHNQIEETLVVMFDLSNNDISTGIKKRPPDFTSR